MSVRQEIYATARDVTRQKRLEREIELVLSMHDEAVYAERSLRAGARGYVTKQVLDERLLTAIHRLLDGEMFIST